jgi:hypothetical protein
MTAVARSDERSDPGAEYPLPDLFLGRKAMRTDD